MSTGWPLNQLVPPPPLVLPPWCKPVEQRERGLGIGGTDIAAICGLSPWRTSFDVWLDKKGDAEPREPQEPSPAQEWGTRLEPVIASAYSDKTENKIIKVGVSLSDPQRPWLVGSPDYLSVDKPLGLDCKTSRFKRDEWGEPGSDQVPDYYITQATWYMILTGAQSWDIPALFYGSDFQIYTVGRNEKLESAILERAEEFWKTYIVGDAKPEVEDSPKVRSWIKSKFSTHLRPMRPATEAERVIAVAYVRERAFAKQHEEEKGDYEVKLKAAIADAEGIEFDGGKATFKSNKDSTFTDWEAVARALADVAYWNGNPEIRDQIISKHTTTKAGARVLRVTYKESK
jgi:putative phage-type endonuclease